jgi:hypothetical protein
LPAPFPCVLALRLISAPFPHSFLNRAVFASAAQVGFQEDYEGEFEALSNRYEEILTIWGPPSAKVRFCFLSLSIRLSRRLVAALVWRLFAVDCDQLMGCLTSPAIPHTPLVLCFSSQANFTFKMKIVLSFAQIVSNLAIGLDIQVSVCSLEHVALLSLHSLTF